MGKYTRKSDRKLVFTEEILNEVKKRLEQGESKRSIAKLIGVNEATLRKRLKAGTIPKSLGRFVSVFSDEMERQLVEYCKQLDNCFYGLTIKSLRELVFEFAERNGVNHRFNKEKKLAGKDWVYSFCKRHKLSVRVAEKTSLARASGFNKVQIRRFFENLKNIIERKHIQSHRIYNMDESGILTVPNKIPKVIAPIGKRTVGKIVSAERGQLVTAVCAISATGKYVPPSLIFPRKRRKEKLINGAPAGSILQISDSGFINTDLFLEWIDHFQKHEKSTPDDPILLILDNHSSHISLAAINKCRSYGIHLLSIPPHSSHRVQPLDRGFFGPLKTAYAQECEKWHVSHPGFAITQYQISELFGYAFSRVASIEKAANAFRSCGIWPYNPDVFTDQDFAAASVTERPESLTEHNPESDLEDIPLSELRKTIKNNKHASTAGYDHSQPSTSACMTLVDSKLTQNINNQKETNLELPFSYSRPSNVSVTPEAIKPLPKANRPPARRKGKKSEVLTDSPFKTELECQMAAKIQRVKRQVVECDAKKSKKSKSSEVRCPRCHDLYSDPPVVDWIQCNQCKNWYHEDCTVYAGLGIFLCEVCDEDVE